MAQRFQVTVLGGGSQSQWTPAKFTIPPLIDPSGQESLPERHLFVQLADGNTYRNPVRSWLAATGLSL